MPKQSKKSSAVVPHPQISNHYQKRVLSSLESANIVEVKKDFFSKVEGCEIYEIVDFLKAMEIKGGEDFVESDLEKILTRVNQQSTAIHVAEASTILEIFAGLKYDKQQIGNLEIRNFSNAFNQEENLGSKDICKFLKACSRLSYDKDELVVDVANLVGKINLQFGNFDLSEKITFLNSLAKLGYDANHGQLNPLVVRMSQEVQGEILQASESQIASFTHSLAKMEFFDQLFESQNRAQEKIISALAPEKIALLSSDSAFSLLQAQMFCHVTFGTKFFDEVRENAIAEKYSPPERGSSNLQRLLGKTLSKKGFAVESEHSIYEIDGKSLRDVDLKASKNTTEYTGEFFIEIDGPTHFFANGISNSATRKRDRLNEAVIANTMTAARCFYVKIPFYEADANRARLSDFLDEKFSQAKEITLQQNIVLEPEAEQKPSSSAVVLSDDLQQNLSISAEEVTTNSASAEITKKKKKKKSGKSAAESKVAADTVVESSDNLLQQAISDKNPAQITAAIRAGIEVNAILPNGLSPFIYAVQSSSRAAYDEDFGAYFYKPEPLSILNVLVAAGADVAQHQADANLLSSICRQSLSAGYESLFCALVKLDSVTVNQGAILEAVNTNSVKSVEAIIAKNALAPNSAEARLAINLAAEGAAKEICDVKILSDLLKSGISPELIKLDSKQPNLAQDLLTKSLTNCPEIFPALFNQEKIRTKLAQEALGNLFELALTIGDEPSVKLMFPMFAEEKSKALIQVCQAGHKNLAKFLLDQGADSRAISTNSLTPLTVSSQNGHAEVVELLLQKGVDIDHRDNAGGCTSLIRAARKGHLDVVKLLLEKGANPDIQSDNGNSALMMAVNNGYADIVEELLEYGADKNLVNKVGGTAQAIAAQNLQNGRPNSFLINLHLNGNDIPSTVIISSSDSTIKIFSNLEKSSNKSTGRK